MVMNLKMLYKQYTNKLTRLKNYQKNYITMKPSRNEHKTRKNYGNSLNL